jgi:hypothetical protein
VPVRHPDHASRPEDRRVRSPRTPVRRGFAAEPPSTQTSTARGPVHRPRIGGSALGHSCAAKSPRCLTTNATSPRCCCCYARRVTDTTRSSTTRPGEGLRSESKSLRAGHRFDPVSPTRENSPLLRSITIRGVVTQAPSRLGVGQPRSTKSEAMTATDDTPASAGCQGCWASGAARSPLDKAVSCGRCLRARVGR